MIEPGRYEAKCIQAELREGNKAPYVAFEYAIMNTNETVWDNGSLSENQFPRGGCPADITIDALMKNGWDGGSLGNLSSVGSVHVELKIAHAEYNGEPKLVVKRVYSLGEGGPANDDTVARLDRALKGRIIDAKKNARNTSPSPPPAQEPDTSFNYGANVDNGAL